MELREELVTFFRIRENVEFFEIALKPKELKGDLYESLVEVGRELLESTLEQQYGNLKGTGILAIMSKKFQTKSCLARLGYHIKLERHITTKWNLQLLPTKELVERINALLGATNRTYGSKITQEIIIEMIEEIERFSVYETNPKGALMNLHQEKNYPTPAFRPIRVSEPDQIPVWKCAIRDEFFGAEKELLSDSFLKQIDAEQDAAQKFLYTLGKVDSPTF